MKPSSANAKTNSTRARNATLLNLLGTPGLGSLMAGRIVAGSGQLVLAVAGFTLVIIWFMSVMSGYYSQMFNEQTTHTPVVFTKLLLGGGIFLLAWVWSLVTSLSLMRAAKQEKISELKTFGAASVKLDEGKIISALGAVPAWQRNGEAIARTFEFQNFSTALKFVNAVAQIAEAAQHHPDVDIRSNKVTLALTTYDVGGLTEKDFALARQCDALSLR
jgi:4a-hydroxytetrahydrobiopterin dehydratase